MLVANERFGLANVWVKGEKGRKEEGEGASNQCWNRKWLAPAVLESSAAEQNSGGCHQWKWWGYGGQTVTNDREG